MEDDDIHSVVTTNVSMPYETFLLLSTTPNNTTETNLWSSPQPTLLAANDKLFPPATVLTVPNGVFMLRLLECLCNFVLLPVSALNFGVIFGTQIMHRNLKFVLLCQCLSVWAFAMVRIAEFVLGRQDYDNQNCSVLFNNLVMVSLFAERFIATLSVKNYERNNSQFFKVASSIYMVSASIFIYFLGIDPNSATMLNTDAELPAIGSAISIVIGLIIWHQMYKFNCRKYASYGAQQQEVQQHSLSERYQLSENIRTFRQLLPTLILHLSNGCFTIAVYFLLVQGVISADRRSQQLANAFVFVFFATSFFLMQLSVIKFHPILNRRAATAFAFLAKWISLPNCKANKNRVTSSTDANVTNNVPSAMVQQQQSQRQFPPNAFPLKDLNGQKLVMHQSADQHFKMLELSWSYNKDQKSPQSL